MKDKIWTWISNNKGATAGILVGLVLGILIFTINFWRTLLLILLIVAGYYFGKANDKGEDFMGKLVAFVDKIFKR